MKKKILSLTLALCMGFMAFPAFKVQAAGSTVSAVKEVNTRLFGESSGGSCSAWAEDDLMVGDTYGIYPMSSYESDMTVPISASDLQVLIAGVRTKIVKTDCATESGNFNFINQLKKYNSVKEVLSIYYKLLSSYQYKGSIGLTKGENPVLYMKKIGVYTGAKKEQKLKEKCSMEQAYVFATRMITYVYDTLNAASKGFLWKIESNGNTVYLLGSIHLASYDIYPMCKTIREAYQKSDALAEEINLYDEKGAEAMAKLGTYSDGTFLRNHVSDETYQKTIAMTTALGYSEEQIAMLKPWMIYCMFNGVSLTDSGNDQDAQTAASLGIDMSFLQNALVYGKPVKEVEGYAYQSKVFDSFSDALQESLLSSVVNSYENIGNGTNTDSDTLDKMLKAWHQGDMETFRKINDQDDTTGETAGVEIPEQEKALTQEFTEKLFTQRDKGMADYIDNLLKSSDRKTTFVVVGSWHYLSDYSVIDILKGKNYEVNQVK